MLTMTIGDGTVNVAHDGRVPDPLGGHRHRYRYTIAARGWSHAGNDIHSGVSDAVDENDAMASLLGFLLACAESCNHRGGSGENGDLFPPCVGEWAVDNSDEISLAEHELRPD